MPQLCCDMRSTQLLYLILFLLFLETCDHNWCLSTVISSVEAASGAPSLWHVCTLTILFKNVVEKIKKEQL